MIRIKDIAEMTGLSITTVSKVLNNKTDEFPQETIDKVLKIAKKYNYTPYAKTKQNVRTKTFRIAYVARNLSKSILTLIGMLDAFREEGYSLLIYDSSDSIEYEEINMNKVLNTEIDGLIWEPIDLEQSSYFKEIKELSNNTDKLKPKVIFINSFRDISNNFYIDYEEMAYIATQNLIERKHKNIACIYKINSLRGSMTLNGYRRCLLDNNISFRDEIPFELGELNNINKDFTNITAIVSSHFTATYYYENYLINKGILIPDDISIVSMMNQVRNNIENPQISTIKIPNYAFGKFIGNKVINYCETSKLNKDNFTQNFEIESTKSLDISRFYRDPYVIVIGSINIDNMVKLQDFPEQGETRFSENYSIEPSGKALIQAKELKLLGKNVALFGKIGNDNNGKLIINELNQNDINTSYITIDNNIKTGISYTAVNQDGKSSVIVVNGANDYFNKYNILKHENIFKNSSYCLIQTDIPLETVREVKKLCLDNNVKIILRASSINSLEKEDYSNLFILIVNEIEAKKLTNLTKINSQIKFFLDRNVKNVIIPLGQKGVYWGKEKQIKFIPSQKTKIVDETGAIDAFTATLCSKLIDGNSMENSIHAAIIAYNYTQSLYGSFNSLIDNANLNRMLKIYSL